MKIKEYIAKTTKEHFQRIYIQGAQLLKTKFGHIGDNFSYKIDMVNKKVEILPDVKNDVSGKGKISKKKISNLEIPVLDISNKKILKAFEGCKECKVTIFEDRILVEGLFDSLNEEETQELIQTLEDANVIDLVARKQSFFIQKDELSIFMKKVSGGNEAQVSLFDAGFSYVGNAATKDSFRQSYLSDVSVSPVIKKAVENEPFVVSLLSLFSGIGAFEQALKKAGIEYDLVNYCEFQPDIARAYSLINNEPIEKNLGDITQVDEKTLPDFQLMTYGFPCQDLTSLGAQKGFKNEDGSLTRSGLFYEAMRIAKYKKPKYMIAENVRALVSKKFKSEFNNMIDLLNSMGYNSYYQVLNSKDYGIPHSRNRVFIVSIRKDVDDFTFKFPEKKPLVFKATDLMEKGCQDDSLYLNEHQKKVYCDPIRLQKKYSSLDSDILVCMNTKQGHPSNPQNFFTDEKGIRILTAREMFYFQGFKKTYGDLLLKNGFNLPQIGYMLGNTISVHPLVALFKNLFKRQLEGRKVISLAY